MVNRCSKHQLFCAVIMFVGMPVTAWCCSTIHYRSYFASHTIQQHVAPSSIVVFYSRQFSKDNGSSFYGSGNDPRDPTNPPSSGGGSGFHTGGGGGGDKRDGWMCPNCGELCSHVDLFICEYRFGIYLHLMLLE